MRPAGTEGGVLAPGRSGAPRCVCAPEGNGSLQGGEWGLHPQHVGRHMYGSIGDPRASHLGWSVSVPGELTPTCGLPHHTCN